MTAMSLPNRGTLLPDTERRENAPQHILCVDRPDDLIERADRCPDVYGRNGRREELTGPVTPEFSEFRLGSFNRNALK